MMEKRHHLDAAEHRSSYYTPYIDVELQFDPLQADPLLQKSLVFDDSDTSSVSNNIDARLESDTYDSRSFGIMASSRHQHKRKLSLAEEESEIESNATSDTSGRFDDADEESDVEQHDKESGVEEKTALQETHSAKRGRSNGWPFQNEIAYDENGMKIDLSGRRQSTPTPTKAATAKNAKSVYRASPVLHIRRSRFVEGSMNDRISEKPPSIYFREEDQMQSLHQQQLQHNLSHSVAAAAATTATATGDKKNLEKRSSGIFRFGKAIASAFHPFGSRGANKSEVWKSSQDGAVAGCGVKSQKEIMKQRQIKAEQAYAELKKSGYKGTGTSTTAFNYDNYDNSNNKVDASIADETWKAIQEKMGYENRISQDDTLVAAPGIREESFTPSCAEKGVSKLKSFSELRKRTSNLNIPAIRFRDASPMSNSSMLPSEREDENSHRTMERRQSRKELNRQAKLMKRVSNLEDKLQRARRELREMADFGGGDDDESTQNEQTVPAVPPVPTICVDDEHGRKFGPGTLPTILSERLLDSGHHVRASSETEVEPEIKHTPAKWPPVDSLSRKRKSPIVAETDNDGNDDDGIDAETYDADCGKPLEDDNKSPRNTTAKRVRNKLKSPRDKRASSLTTKASQRLKAKQTSRNLRQSVKNGSSDNNDERCLQEQEGNTTSTPTTPSSSPKKKKSGRAYYGGGENDYENIPPVPPVPQELLQGTTPSKTLLKPRIPSKEFSWPEDIF